MKTKSEIAVSKFNEGFNCAQAVVFSFCDDLNFDKDTALNVACGFGAGMGRKEEVCGAVTGSIIALGIKYGRTELSDTVSTETTYQKTRELMDGFELKHGSVICRKLLGGVELTTEKGQKQFKEMDLRNKVCVHCVRNAVEILEEIMK